MNDDTISSLDIDEENISINAKPKKVVNQPGDTLIPSSQDLGSNSDLGDIDDFGKDNIELESVDSTYRNNKKRPPRGVMGQGRDQFNQSVD